MQPSEVIVSVRIPAAAEHEWFMNFKQCRRRDDDIAIVNAGMRVKLEPGTHRVLESSLAFGGMAAKSVNAPQTERFLVGRIWNQETLEGALELLAQGGGGKIFEPGSYSRSAVLASHVASLQSEEQTSPHPPSARGTQPDLPMSIDAPGDFTSVRHATNKAYVQVEWRNTDLRWPSLSSTNSTCMWHSRVEVGQWTQLNSIQPQDTNLIGLQPKDYSTTITHQTRPVLQAQVLVLL